MSTSHRAALTFTLLAALSLSGGAGCGGKDAGTANTLQRFDLSPTAPSLARGAVLQVRATAIWSVGAPEDVSAASAWSSSNPAVATVAGGVVTGIAAGSAVIAATWTGHEASVPVEVTPAALVALAIDPPAGALPKGTRRTFTATGTYTDGTTRDVTASATWTTSAAGILELPTGAAPGEVRGAAAGTATLRAAQDGREATAPVTVTAPALAELRVSPAAGTAPLGLSTRFSAIGVYSDGTTADLTAEVLWTVDGGLAVFPAGAPAGTVHALTIGGPTVVHALLPGAAVAGEATLTVTAAVPLSVDVSPGAATLAAGLTRAFTATAVLSDGAHLDVTSQAAWTSSLPTVAAVSTAPATAGQVTALAPGGPVTITAALPGAGVAGTATLTVAAAAVAALDVTPTTASVPAGRTQAFIAEAVLTDGRRLPATDDATWSSSDPGIAPVSNAAGTRGLATGLRAGGPVAISARLPGTPAVGAASLEVAPPTLVALAVEPAELFLASGTAGRLRATGTFSDGTHADLTGAVTWSSADPATADVGTGAAGAGVVTTFRAGGPVAITARLPGEPLEGAAAVTVTPAALVRLEVSPASASVALGRAAPYTATGVFTDGRRQDLTAQVSWLSSDVAVATISNALASTGMAQSRGEGTAELLAWFPGTTLTASASLTVTPPELVALAVSPAGATIPAGRRQQFSASGTFTDGVVRDLTGTATWTSSAPAVAATTALPGELHGLSPGGPVTVTATLGAVAGLATLTVGPAVIEAIAVSPASTPLRFGESVDLTAVATLSDATQRDVTATAAWSETPAGVLRLLAVPGAERATAVGLGHAVVTASIGGAAGTAAISVDPVLPEAIVLRPAGLRLAPGELSGFRAMGLFAGGVTIDVTELATWTSSDPLVASSGAAAGSVQAIASGAATFTATFGASATGAVTVTAEPIVPALDAIVVSGAELPLGVNGLARLTATGVYDNGASADFTNAVTWASSDPAIASVAATGLARGVSPGSVTVTATEPVSGVSGAAPLAVLPASPVDTLVIRIPPRVVAGQPVQAAAIGLLADGREVDLTRAVSWLAAGGASHRGGGLFTFTGATGRIAAAWQDQLVVADVLVVPLDAAASYRIVPGDASLAPLDPGGVLGGQVTFAAFTAVLEFDDAFPRQVVAGACTTDRDPAGCVFGWIQDGGVALPGCELPCQGGPGATLCLPLSPVTRTIECTAGSLVARATATVTATPTASSGAALFIRPLGWAAQRLSVAPGAGGGVLVPDLTAPPTPALHPGETIALEAVEARTDGSLVPVQVAWLSTDSTVASLESPGLFRGRAPGSTLAQARTSGLGALLELGVVPSYLPAPFLVSGPDPVVAGGPEVTYTARSIPDGLDLAAGLAWSSSDPSVLAATATPGTFVPLAAGRVTVTATSRGGFTASIDVTVLGPVALEVYPGHALLLPGETLTPLAFLRFSDGQLADVTPFTSWASFPDFVLQPTGTGSFQAMGPGIAQLTGAFGGFESTVSVAVDPAAGPPALDAIVLTGLPPAIVGQTVRGTALAVFTNGGVGPIDGSYSFTTGDPAVAVPSGADPGAVLGVGPGTTTFTVTDASGTVSATTPVTVFELVSLALSPATISLAVGEGSAIEVSGIDTAGQRHVFRGLAVSSDAPAVVESFPGADAIVAVGPGQATLSVSLAGLTATGSVTVSPAAPVQLSVAPNPLVLELGARFQLRATAQLTDGSLLDVSPGVTFRTLDPAVAALPAAEAAGTVEAAGPGATFVEAAFSANGRRVTALVPVEVVVAFQSFSVIADPSVFPVGLDTVVRAGAFLPDGRLVELTGTVTWTVSNPLLLGPVPGQPNAFTGRAPGEVTITGTTPGGTSATSRVVVTPAVPVQFEITPAIGSGTVGQPTAFTALAVFSDGTSRDITLEVGWTAFGRVQQIAPGVFVPDVGGTFNIGASFDAGPVVGLLETFATFEVPHAFTAIFVGTPLQPVWEGDTVTFTAELMRDDGQVVAAGPDVTWQADRPEAVPTGAPGAFTFLGHGPFAIRATTADGVLSSEAVVFVNAAPVSLEITPAAPTVVIGQPVQFVALLTYSDGSVVDVSNSFEWTAAGDPIALWTGVSGLFDVFGVGTAQIAYGWTDGLRSFQATATLTSLPVPPPP